MMRVTHWTTVPLSMSDRLWTACQAEGALFEDDASPSLIMEPVSIGEPVTCLSCLHRELSGKLPRGGIVWQVRGENGTPWPTH